MMNFPGMPIAQSTGKQPEGSNATVPSSSEPDQKNNGTQGVVVAKDESKQ